MEFYLSTAFVPERPGERWGRLELSTVQPISGLGASGRLHSVRQPSALARAHSDITAGPWSAPAPSLPGLSFSGKRKAAPPGAQTSARIPRIKFEISCSHWAIKSGPSGPPMLALGMSQTEPAAMSNNSPET
jgi:hypothetical protein